MTCQPDEIEDLMVGCAKMARLRPYLKYKNPGCIKNISTKMVGLCNARGFIRINTFTNNHYV